jgi:hypothetical protein
MRVRQKRSKLGLLSAQAKSTESNEIEPGHGKPNAASEPSSRRRRLGSRQRHGGSVRQASAGDLLSIAHRTKGGRS